MAEPTNRDEFKETILRRLGKPLVNVNVTDEQLEDRIDEALKYYYDYHYDGAKVDYLVIQVTDQMKIDKYYNHPTNDILSVRSVWSMGQGGTNTSETLFNFEYQILVSDLQSMISTQLLPYYLMKTQIEMYRTMFQGQIPFRYNEHENRIYIDTNWDKWTTGQFIVVEVQRRIDETTYNQVWSDRWLQRYATAITKRQWAVNLNLKFNGIPLLNGVNVDARGLYDDAVTEIKELEDQMISAYSYPPMDVIA